MKQNLTYALIASLVCAALTLLGCGDDDSGSSGDEGVAVFVTSKTFIGDLGGLAGADLICTASARGADLTGRWTAWLSDDIVDAKDRILNAEYRLLDGTTIIASSKSDLTDGMIEAPINVTEAGDTITAAPEVWTGTATTGVNAGAGTCSGWTSGTDSEVGLVGRMLLDSAGWTTVGAASNCDNFHRLYCFSDEIVEF